MPSQRATPFLPQTEGGDVGVAEDVDEVLDEIVSVLPKLNVEDPDETLEVLPVEELLTVELK